MRYIYFEIYHESDGKSIGEGYVRNQNILLIKPKNLNSRGYWGFRHMTEKHTNSSEYNADGDLIIQPSVYITVDQCWVDLSVYRTSDHGSLVAWPPLVEWVDRAIKLIIEDYRDYKIDLVGI